MKINRPGIQIENEEHPGIRIGEVPYLFRQKALSSITGRMLRPGGLSLTEDAVEICGFMPGDRILDAGCGYGMTARHLARAHQFHVSAMDLSFDMLADAVREPEAGSGPGRKTSPSPEYVQSKLPAIPFAQGIFDGIFCECVLSLVPEKQTCLKEFFRVLKNRGRLVLTDLYVPEPQAPKTCPPDVLPAASCLDGALALPELIKAVETAGFTIDVLENHTRLLKQLAGQIIFDHGSLEAFWNLLPVNLKNSCRNRQIRNGNLKPGYCMIIAGKYE